MFSRVVITAASLTLAAVAALLLDCASQAITIFGEATSEMCGSAASLGMTGDIWIGVGLAVMAVLSLALTWIPALRPGERRRRLSPTETLSRNLARITEVAGEPHRPDDLSPREARLAGFRRRFEAVEASLDSDVVSSEAAERWVDLLREANEMHNDGDLETEEFKTINTRLFELYTAPSESARA